MSPSQIPPKDGHTTSAVEPGPHKKDQAKAVRVLDKRKDTPDRAVGGEMEHTGIGEDSDRNAVTQAAGGQGMAGNAEEETG